MKRRVLWLSHWSYSLWPSAHHQVVGVLLCGVCIPAIALGMDQGGDALVSEIVSQASLAANASTPAVGVPAVLLSLGRAAAGCSVTTAVDFDTKALEAAQKLHVSSGADAEEARSAKRRIPVAAIDHLTSLSLSRKQPEITLLARTLAGQIDYKETKIDRQRAFQSILKAVLRFSGQDAALQLVSEIETSEGAFPFRLAEQLFDESSNDELKQGIARRTYAALAAGQCRVEGDLDLVEKAGSLVPSESRVASMRSFLQKLRDKEPSTPESMALAKRAQDLLSHWAPDTKDNLPSKQGASDPEQQEDATSRLYHDLQAAAEQSAGALSQKALGIQDAHQRQALLILAADSLRRQGKLEAADRVGQVISSLQDPALIAAHPAETLLGAQSTFSGDRLLAQVQLALDAADKSLSEERQKFEATSNETERLKIYLTAGAEPVAAYGIAAEIALESTAERALRVIGPRRAEVLAEVLNAACRRKQTGALSAVKP